MVFLNPDIISEPQNQVYIRQICHFVDVLTKADFSPETLPETTASSVCRLKHPQ